MIDKLIAFLGFWLIGMPIYLPWLLARLGYYKKWYFAPFMPPFSWRGWIQAWPISAVFVLAPFIGLLPTDIDTRTNIWGAVGIAGVVFAIIIMIWTPRWAKPPWQRRLEDRFSHEQISAFITTWRKMSFPKWCEMIDTEEGMLELVDYAIENQTRLVDSAVRLRVQQLANAKERRLKRKPAWDFQDSET